MFSKIVKSSGETGDASGDRRLKLDINPMTWREWPASGVVDGGDHFGNLWHP